MSVCYIAFSPNEKGNAYANMLDDGLTELRSDGRLKKILQKYGLEDWLQIPSEQQSK